MNTKPDHTVNEVGCSTSQRSPSKYRIELTEEEESELREVLMTEALMEVGFY